MSDRAPLPYDFFPEVPSFTLTSDDVADGDTLPQPQLSAMFGAGGEDRSPALAWSGFPADTRSFAITMYDPDAPTGSGFWHWAVCDIPVEVTALAAGAGNPGSSDLPGSALTVRNDAGIAGFLGAAPPEGLGEHRYVFVVHALDTESLGLDGDASPAFVGFNLRFHTLARATLIATYGR